MSEDIPLIRELIAPAVDRLDSLGIEHELTISPFVDGDQLDAFISEFGLKLPPQMRALYAESDGFDIFWESGEDAGGFTLPSLYELRLFRQRWVNGDMPDRSYTTHLKKDVADRLLEQMKFWLPFDDSTSGELMCIDCSTGRVVEYDHAWGNLTKTNGTIFAIDLYGYIRHLARICFHWVWIAYPERVLRGSECWADWASTQVPRKYVIRDSNSM